MGLRISKHKVGISLEYIFLYVTLAYWINDATNIVFVRCIQLLTLGILMYITHRKIMLQDFYLSAIILFLSLLTVLLKSSFLKLDISFFSSIIIVVLMLSAIRWEEFCLVFSNFMYFIACFSLCTYFAYLLVPSIFLTMPISHATVDTANVFFSLVPTNMDDYFRNFGCFTEPGMYQVYLNLALIVCLFVQKTSIKRVIVLCIAIVTTFSTAGYFALLVIIIAYFFNKTRNRTDKKLRRYMVAALLMGLVVVGYLFVSGYLGDYSYVFKKLTEFSIEGSTANVRSRAFVYGLEQFKNNILLGCGWGEWIELYKTGINLTCTQINYFAIYGVIIGTFFNAAYVIWAQGLCKSKIAKIFLVLAVEMILFSQDLLGGEIWIMIAIYAYRRKNSTAIIHEI